MTKEKGKIVVNEVIDKQINSLALAITFIVLGVLLTAITDYVGSEAVTSILRWIFVILGFVGLASSFGNGESAVKGTDDIAAGIAVSAVAVLIFRFVPNPFGGGISLLVLLFGLYGLVRGVLFVICTVYLNSKKARRDGKGVSFALVLEGLSKLAALALVIAQLVKIWAS